MIKQASRGGWCRGCRSASSPGCSAPGLMGASGPRQEIVGSFREVALKRSVQRDIGTLHHDVVLHRSPAWEAMHTGVKPAACCWLLHLVSMICIILFAGIILL